MNINDVNTRIFNDPRAGGNAGVVKEQKQFTPITNYKPTGNLVYNPDILEKIEKKVSFI